MSIKELIEILKEIQECVDKLYIPSQKETELEKSYFRLLELYNIYKEYEEFNYLGNLVSGLEIPGINVKPDYVIKCMNIFDRIAKQLNAKPKDECFETYYYDNKIKVRIFFDLYHKELVITNFKKNTVFKAKYDYYEDFYERLLKDLTLEKLLEL